MFGTASLPGGTAQNPGKSKQAHALKTSSTTSIVKRIFSKDVVLAVRPRSGTNPRHSFPLPGDTQSAWRTENKALQMRSKHVSSSFASEVGPQISHCPGRNLQACQVHHWAAWHTQHLDSARDGGCDGSESGPSPPPPCQQLPREATALTLAAARCI